MMPKRLSGLAAGVYVGGFIWGYLGAVFADGIWYRKYLWLIIGVIVTLVTMGAVAFQEPAIVGLSSRAWPPGSA